jgi:hypothetical protein
MDEQQALERDPADYRHHTQQPWTIAILERLSSGPAPWSDLISTGAAFVPPGRAHRFWLRVREGKKPKSRRVSRQPSDRSVILGGRGVASTSLAQLKQQGRIEVFYDGDTRMVKIARGQKIRRATARSEDMLRFFAELAPGTLSARDLRERWNTYDNYIKRIPRDRLPYQEVPYGDTRKIRRYHPDDVRAYERKYMGQR